MKSIRVWKYSLDPAESHFVLVQICIGYLLVSDFKSGNEAKRNDNQEDKNVNEYCNKYRLLDYTANHWFTHVKQAKVPQLKDLLQSSLKLYNPRCELCKIWSQVYNRSQRFKTLKFEPGIPKLIVASALGHTLAVDLMLGLGEKIETKDRLGRTALWAAATNEDHKMINFLLDRGADHTTQDNHGVTVLRLAVMRGNREIVSLLLDRKAEKIFGTEEGNTAMFWAVMAKDKMILGLLSDRSVDLKDKSVKKFIAMEWYEELLGLLLDRGVDIETRNLAGQTALIQAASCGQEDMVRLLFNRGAKIETKDNGGATALNYAVENKGEGMMKLLLGRRANLNSEYSGTYNLSHYAPFLRPATIFFESRDRY